jgi:ubiquinone/menaquinone biosynthesis C-methylase UbiE
MLPRNSCRQVIATDASEAQLQHAKQAPNVRYFPSDAHTIDLPNGSADLVTVASALHWLDHPRFYREVRRVLKPHGCFAAWAIPLVRVSSCWQRQLTEGPLHHRQQQWHGLFDQSA